MKNPSGTIMLLLAATCLLSTVTALAVAPDSSSVESPKIEADVKDKVCDSLDCYKQSVRMLSWMNTSVNPCDDFYQYACGKFSKEVLLDPSMASDPYKYVMEFPLFMAGDTVNRRVYELLTRPEAVTDTDPDINDLYNIARNFYGNCSQWLADKEKDADNRTFSGDFLSGLLHQIRKDIGSTKVWSTEVLLAMLIKTGAGGMLTINIDKDSQQQALHFPETYVQPGIGGLATISMRIPNFPTNKSDLEPIVSYLKADAVIENVSFSGLENNLTEIISSMNSSANEHSWISDCRVGADSGTVTQWNSTDTITVKQLDDLSKCASPKNPFLWSILFNNILGREDSLDRKVKIVNASSVIGLVNYLKLQEPTSDKFLASKHVAFILFDWLVRFADFFPSSLQTQLKDFMRFGVDRYFTEPALRCVETTKNALNQIVSRMYYKAYIDPKAIGFIDKLIKLGKQVAEKRISQHSKISEEGKSVLTDRLKNHFGHSIGFDMLSDSDLKVAYESALKSFTGLSSDAPKFQLFGQLSAIALNVSWLDNFFAVFSGKKNISGFDLVHPLDSQGYNIIEKHSNHIYIPLAMLVPPFYNPSAPDYINLGSMGVITAQLLSFMFWEPKTLAYLKNSRGDGADQELCLKEQYKNLHNDSFGRDDRYQELMALRDRDTFIRDMSDVLGVQLALHMEEQFLESYGPTKNYAKLPDPLMKLGLSKEKLFFVSAAQAWCSKSDSPLRQYELNQYCTVNSIRVNGETMNSEKFANVFSCPAGSTMNPVEKCYFW